MAKLYFYYGTMFSSKSADLIGSVVNYEVRGKKVLIFTSDKDDRAKNLSKEETRSLVTTRFAQKNEEQYSKEAYLIERVDFYKIIKDEKPECVFVDETQFISTEIILMLSKVVDALNTPVICYGLRSDSNMNMFPASQLLFVIADELIEKQTICTHPGCNKKAIFNLRKVNNKPVFDGDQIAIEKGNVSFYPYCRKHYMEYREKFFEWLRLRPTSRENSLVFYFYKIKK